MSLINRIRKASQQTKIFRYKTYKKIGCVGYRKKVDFPVPSDTGARKADRKRHATGRIQRFLRGLERSSYTCHHRVWNERK